MNKYSVYSAAGIVLLLALFSCTSKQKSSAWKGTITEENGVNVVRNPKKPVFEGDIVFFEEELSIGAGEKGADEYIFVKPKIIADADGNIFVLDSKPASVRMYSPTGEFIRFIGRQGSGPGEYANPSYIGLSHDNLLWIWDSGNKILFFSKEGDFIKETAFDISLSPRWFDESDNLFGIHLRSNFTKQSDFNNIKLEYQLIKFAPPYGKKEKIIGKSLNHNLIPVEYMSCGPLGGNRYFWAFSWDYTIHVMNSSGKECKRIIKEYDNIRLYDETKELYPNLPPQREYRKYELPFWTVMAAEEGHLFVLKSYFMDKKVFDIFDPEGRYVGKKEMKIFPSSLKKDAMYAVVEDDDGYQYIKRYKMTWADEVQDFMTREPAL